MTPKPPKELQAAGRPLWRAIIADVAAGWRLDARDLALLRRASVIQDWIVALDAVVAADGVMTSGSRGQARVHPAVQEMRGLAAVQKSLLGAIELEDPAAALSLARSRTATRTAAWRQRSTG
jgi:hypothetical protein